MSYRYCEYEKNMQGDFVIVGVYVDDLHVKATRLNLVDDFVES